MNVLGLDLGTSSLKLVELEKARDNWGLSKIGIIANPLGRLIPGDESQRVKLVEAIKKLISDTKVNGSQVRVGLSESHVYTRVINLPAMSDAELSSAIRWEAEQRIPVPLTEVQLDWAVVNPKAKSKDGKMQVLLVGARKQVVNSYVDLLTGTGLELIGLETVLLSLVRALTSDQDPPTLLINIGAGSTDFALTSGGHILLTHSVLTGGASLTRAIEQELGLSVSQAEQYKRAYGLDESSLQGKVKAALMPVFNSVMTEAKKAINSYESTRSGKKIPRVILSGGSALLPEISSQVTAALGVSETIIADPFFGMEIPNNISVPPERCVYSVAIGLAKGGG